MVIWSHSNKLGFLNLCLYPSSSQKSKKIMLWCLYIRTFSSSHHMLKILWLLWYYINHIIHLWTWNLIFSYLIQWPRLKNYITAITTTFVLNFSNRFAVWVILEECKYLNSTLLWNFHQVIDNMIYGWRFLPVNAMGDVWCVQFVLFDDDLSSDGDT